MMKKALTLSLLAIALSACQSGFNSGRTPSSSVSAAGFRMKSSHYSDVAKIRAEANRLGTQVREGKLTKVQAAQHLNRFRLDLVGHNNVDDSVYEVYLRSAVDNQRGSITAQQKRAQRLATTLVVHARKTEQPRVHQLPVGIYGHETIAINRAFDTMPTNLIDSASRISDVACLFIDT